MTITVVEKSPKNLIFCLSNLWALKFKVLSWLAIFEKMRRFGVIFSHSDIVLPPLYPTSGHLGKHSYKLKKVVRRCRDYRSKSSFSILVKAIPKMRGCYCMIMHQCMFINKKKKLDDIKLRPFDVPLCQIRIICDDVYWIFDPKKYSCIWWCRLP